MWSTQVQNPWKWEIPSQSLMATTRKRVVLPIWPLPRRCLHKSKMEQRNRIGSDPTRTARTRRRGQKPPKGDPIEDPRIKGRFYRCMLSITYKERDLYLSPIQEVHKVITRFVALKPSGIVYYFIFRFFMQDWVLKISTLWGNV